MSNNTNEYCLVLCYANWCGHCVTFYKKDKNGKPLSLNEAKENKIVGLISWQEVKEACKKNNIMTAEFEHEELKNNEHGSKFVIDIEKDVQGWPTILLTKLDKESGKYKPHAKYGGERGNVKDFIDFVNNGGKNKELKGGVRTNYRLKYKKYKSMYAELVKKYNDLI